MSIRDENAIPLTIPRHPMHFGIDDVGIVHALEAVSCEKLGNILKRGGYVFILRNEGLFHGHLRVAVRASHLAQIVGRHPEHIIHDGPAP